MEDLFRSWPAFASACRNAAHVLLLFDYDGTLTPIAPRPEDAVLAAGMKDKLTALARLPKVTAGVISGRSLAELMATVGVDGLYYAGNHGLEIRGPGLDWTSPEAERSRALMGDMAARFHDALDRTRGVIVQDKGLSLSVHYRLVAAGEAESVIAAFQRLAGPLAAAGKLKITTGKKVLEVRPPLDWDKGRAVEAIRRGIMASLKLERMMTLYLGDDRTDEDAFRALRGIPGGWGIYIGGESREFSAGYYLGSPGDVATLLDRLLAAL